MNTGEGIRQAKASWSGQTMVATQDSQLVGRHVCYVMLYPESGHDTYGNYARVLVFPYLIFQLLSILHAACPDIIIFTTIFTIILFINPLLFIYFFCFNRIICQLT